MNDFLFEVYQNGQLLNKSSLEYWIEVINKINNEFDNFKNYIDERSVNKIENEYIIIENFQSIIPLNYLDNLIITNNNIDKLKETINFLKNKENEINNIKINIKIIEDSENKKQIINSVQKTCLSFSDIVKELEKELEIKMLQFYNPNFKPKIENKIFFQTNKPSQNLTNSINLLDNFLDFVKKVDLYNIYSINEFKNLEKKVVNFVNQLNQGTVFEIKNDKDINKYKIIKKKLKEIRYDAFNILNKLAKENDKYKNIISEINLIIQIINEKIEPKLDEVYNKYIKLKNEELERKTTEYVNKFKK